MVAWITEKKDPEAGRFKYTSIVDRCQKDPDFHRSCNEESQKEFGKYFILKDAYEADELAAHEEIFGERRLIDNALPAKERREKYTMPEVRSTQSGGSGTRRRIGTEEEQRAIEALKGREKGKSKDRDRGKGGKTQTKLKQMFEHRPQHTYDV